MRGFSVRTLTPRLQRSFGFGIGPGPSRGRNLLKVGLEDIFVQPQHQAAALGAKSGVIIQTGYPLVPAATVDTLILVNWHNGSPPRL